MIRLVDEFLQSATMFYCLEQTVSCFILAHFSVSASINTDLSAGTPFDPNKALHK